MGDEPLSMSVKGYLDYQIRVGEPTHFGWYHSLRGGMDAG